MSRNSCRLVLIAAVALPLTLAACGSGQEAASPSTPSVVSENTSAPVVAGPRPGSETPATSASAAGSHDCGTTAGPDGALRITVTAGAVDCADAKAVAAKYGPMIATGQIQTVDGWKCGPAQITGVLAACTRSVDGVDQVVSFAP